MEAKYQLTVINQLLAVLSPILLFIIVIVKDKPLWLDIVLVLFSFVLLILKARNDKRRGVRKSILPEVVFVLLALTAIVFMAYV